MYGESLIHSFLPLGVISSVKSPNKKKNYCPENEMCVCVCVCVADVLFCHICFEQNYSVNFPNNPHSKQGPKPLHQWRS